MICTHPSLAVHTLLGVVLEAGHAEQVLASRALRHVLEGELTVATLALDPFTRFQILALVQRLGQTQVTHLLVKT